MALVVMVGGTSVDEPFCIVERLHIDFGKVSDMDTKTADGPSECVVAVQHVPFRNAGVREILKLQVEPHDAWLQCRFENGERCCDLPPGGKAVLLVEPHVSQLSARQGTVEGSVSVTTNAPQRPRVVIATRIEVMHAACPADATLDAPVPPGETVSSSCHLCGKQLVLNAPFCPYCGTKTDSMEERNETDEAEGGDTLSLEQQAPVIISDSASPSSRRKPVRFGPLGILMGVLILMVLAVGARLWLAGRSQSTSTRPASGSRTVSPGTEDVPPSEGQPRQPSTAIDSGSSRGKVQQPNANTASKSNEPGMLFFTANTDQAELLITYPSGRKERKRVREGGEKSLPPGVYWVEIRDAERIIAHRQKVVIEAGEDSYVNPD